MKKYLLVMVLIALSTVSLSFAQTLELKQNGITVWTFTCPTNPNPIPCTSCSQWGSCVSGIQTCTNALPSGCTGSLFQSCTTPPGPTPIILNPPTSLINTRLTPDSGLYGYDPPGAGGSGQYFNAIGGMKYIFIIDPVLAGAGPGKPMVTVGDTNQGIPMFSIHLWVLDSSNNKILELGMTSGNCQYSSVWPKGFSYNGERLLLEFVASKSIQGCLLYWFAN